MKIAGIEIPAKLEFGNKEHIELRNKVEHRLSLIETGMRCQWCGYKMGAIPNYEKESIRWICNVCGDNFTTNLDGE